MYPVSYTDVLILTSPVSSSTTVQSPTPSWKSSDNITPLGILGLGEVDGELLGLEDGEPLGLVLGLLLGLALGEAEGDPLGEALGELLGLPLGDDDGLLLGLAELLGPAEYVTTSFGLLPAVA